MYKQLAEKMKLLWTKDLKMNTVHVRDVVRALWHLKDAGPPGEIYNLVDKGETSEGIKLWYDLCILYFFGVCVCV